MISTTKQTERGALSRRSWVSRYPMLDFTGAKGDGSGGDNWSYKTVQSSSQIITTNKPTPTFFTGRTPFLSPNQQCQSTDQPTLGFYTVDWKGTSVEHIPIDYAEQPSTIARIQQRSTSDFLSPLLKWSFVGCTCTPENDPVSYFYSGLWNWIWLIPTYTIISCNIFSSAAFAIFLLHRWLFVNIILSFYFIQSNAILAKVTFECWQWFCHFFEKICYHFPHFCHVFIGRHTMYGYTQLQTGNCTV